MDINNAKRNSTPPMPGSQKKVQINDTPQVKQEDDSKAPSSKKWYK